MVLSSQGDFETTNRDRDDSSEMQGAGDVEVSDNEKNLAQFSIRRSVVSKDKLNWSS
jgi:hypothetical protein